MTLLYEKFENNRKELFKIRRDFAGEVGKLEKKFQPIQYKYFDGYKLQGSLTNTY